MSSPAVNKGGRPTDPRFLAAFRSFVDEHGHGRVPQRHVTDDGVRLGKWVANLRDRYRDGRLPDTTAAQMDVEPGWVWNARAQSWDEHLSALTGFVAEHDRLPLSSENVTPATMHEWIRTQRRFYQDDRLEPARVAALEAIPCWQWRVSPAEAQARAAAACPPRPRNSVPLPDDEDFVIEIRWAGSSMRTVPLGSVRAAPGLTLDELVPTVLQVARIEPELHLWRFMTAPGNRTDDRFYLTTPDGVTGHYVCESEFDDPLLEDWGSAPAQRATGVRVRDLLPVTGDQMWMLWDYGDWDLFRLRVRRLRAGDTALRKAGGRVRHLRLVLA